MKNDLLFCRIFHLVPKNYSILVKVLKILWELFITFPFRDHIVILGGRGNFVKKKKGIETLFPTLYKSIITPVMQIKSLQQA